ncbi:hypothetical protein [Nocardia goodfellowii]|uniref:Uncharacterized protein n=1 Tax=Nocardia goodfellowii TaxID=882446 RepID=A0ABS4QEM9_9NOCA|nr:hypothetical protein [Nocardia goodfellowii]MBP2190161.1 hypothetical protein [Nocardia goodfellowii]
MDHPRIPAWILWLYERSPGTAQFCYQLHYPIGVLPAEYWTRDRAFRTESAARSVERARRFHAGRVPFASTPDLPDDDAFYATWSAEADWTGHWYSRDPAEAWDLAEPDAI